MLQNPSSNSSYYIVDFSSTRTKCLCKVIKSEDIAKITYQGISDGGMRDESVCQRLHIAVGNLRDRWLNTPGIIREVPVVPTISAKDGTSTQSVSDGDQREIRLLRDGNLCSEKEGTGPLHWVPYVHFMLCIMISSQPLVMFYRRLFSYTVQ